jgi:PAS domain S-box-containing protein
MSERLYDFVIPVNQEFMFLDDSLAKKELIRGILFRRIFAHHTEVVRVDHELRILAVKHYREVKARSGDADLADRWMFMRFDNGDSLLVKGHVEEIDHSEYTMLVRHQIISYKMGTDEFESAGMSKSNGQRLKHNEYLLALWEPSAGKLTFSDQARKYIEHWSARTVIDESFLSLIPKELLTDITTGQEALMDRNFPLEIAGLESTDQFDLSCSRVVTNIAHPTYLFVLQRTQQQRHSIHFNGEFYRTILNSATIDMCVFDTSHRYLFINKNAVRNDQTREWLIGKTDFDYCAYKGLDTSKAEMRRAYFNKALETMETVAMEERQVNQNGETHHTIKYFKPIQDGQLVKYVIGFGLDITKQKEIEHNLRESEGKYRDLFESSLDLIQSVDKEGKFLFYNNAWAQKLGYTAEELKDKTIFSIIDPEQMDHCMPIFQRVFTGESVMDIQVVFRAKNGNRLELEGNVVPRVENGEVIATHAFLRDVTERNYKEELLRQSLAEKESLLGEIHHRVKNNLTVVYSLLELQALKEKDEKIKQVFKESQARIRSMALVHEKLYQSDTFSRVDLTSYLRELTQYIVRINYGSSKPIHVIFEGENVFVDINQAVPCGLLANEIFTNACKYAFTNTEHPVITITTEEGDKDNLLTIRDNGEGLPDDFNLASIDTLGFRLIKTFVSQIKGTLKMQNDNGLVYHIKFPRK